MTIEQLSQLSDISEERLKELEIDATGISTFELSQLSEAYHKRIQWLMGIE